uniref:Uncharacterized protein n=1 Tax=Vitis vinifera TaxID=29760 RepID=A5BVT4_VITVI|nr:hypothetical protein VITISV_012650 [Vitis vinifera]
MATHEAPRVEVPKPHTFSGKRDAKELDNFLWHMERYFEAIALTDEATKAKSMPKMPQSKELMYVEALVNGKATKALVDTGVTSVTHNFVLEDETKRLELQASKEGGWLKAVNSAAKPSHGVARGVAMHIGSWEGMVDFTVAPMDDFKMVLGMDFLQKVKAVPLPFLCSMVILEEEKPCMVPTVTKGTLKTPMLSAMQVKKGLKRKEVTYLTTLKEERDVGSGKPMPKEIEGILDEFKDVTVKNKYPIPLIADLFDQLGRVRYFTKLDLRSGYYQVKITEGDEPKTTCVTRYDSYEFLVMPFGLTNAPAIFCTLMNKIFHPYLDKFVVVYLDDIVIYSNTLKEHVEHLRKVFKILRQNELYVKREKCSFSRGEVSFLGHRIKDDKLMMDDSKVNAIQEWDPPTKDYSARAAPLIDLLKKNKAWEWDERCQQAFEDLKKAVTEEPVLALLDHTKVFEVHTDASDFAIGGVLMQERHQIAFESCKINNTERHYTVQEKEMTAIVHYLRTWRHYLLGSHFIVKTDNFDYTLEYKLGSANHVADALSHKAELASMTSQPQGDIMNLLREGLQHDPVAKSLIALAHEGKTKRFWAEDGLLYTKGKRLYVPKWGNIRRNLIKKCHDTKWAGHPEQRRTRALLESAYYWPQIRDEVEAYVRTCLVCQQDKVEQRQPRGLLEPLPIAEHPWDSITMDFIIGLPKSEDNDSIIVVVDRFSKYATFIATLTDCTAERTTRLFPNHVYLRHFVSVNQKDWAKLLDIAQFSYNLQRSEAINKSPFELATGQQPLTPHTLMIGYTGRSPATFKFAKWWHEQTDIVRSYLDKVAKKMKKWADKK